MRIAILTEILSTHSGSRAPIELAKQLSLDNKITLLAYSSRADEKVKKELQNLGIKISLIKPAKFPFGKWWMAFKFLPHLKGNDVISFHGTLLTFLVARLSGLPIIQTYYGTQLDAYFEKLLPNQQPTTKDRLLNWMINQVVLLIQKIYFVLADASVAISKYTSCEAKKLFRRNIQYIHLGATALPFDKRSTTKDQRLITLLSVSRITPYKGFHLLIEAVKKSQRKIKLTIVGSSPQSRYLNYLKRIKTPTTKILTDVSDNQLAKLYQECDIYASCDRFLFFGLPPLEAALFGKPSVLLDYCAAPEVVQHNKTGLVAKNMPDFVKYLQILADNSKMRTQMGRRAKKWAEDNFSWEKTGRLYEEMFKKWKN